MANPCVICLEEITTDDKTVCIDGCDHVVHSACFFAYAKYKVKDNNSVTCPMCRHVVIDIQPPETHIEYRVIDDEALEQEKKKLRTIVTLCFIIFGLNAMYLLNEIFIPQ